MFCLANISCCLQKQIKIELQVERLFNKKKALKWLKTFPYLQISDDERMSLTTAVSEEEDEKGDAVCKSKGERASFNCTGAVRKAGWVL